MKSLLRLLLPLLAVSSAQALDRAEYVTLGTSVLRIEVPRAGGGYALGSGVAVDADKVVTNCHVTREGSEIRVVREGVRWRVAAQASDLARDLCLLLVPGLAAPAVQIGRAADLAIGQAVTAIGFTGGLGMQSSQGEVVELHRHDGGRVIQSTNWFSSGASGGGLFDAAGRLVGILTFRLRGGEVHYFSAPAEWVQQLLDGRERARFDKVMPLGDALPYWQAAAAAQPRFLQASSLQHDARWSELETVARAWARSEPDDPEPWHLLGAALEQLDRLPEAQHALECCLDLAPGHIAARAQLAGLMLRRPRAAGSAANGLPVCQNDLPRSP